MLETRKLGDLIRDLREKPFERDISDFVITPHRYEDRGSGGIDYRAELVVDINKRKGCREELKYHLCGGFDTHGEEDRNEHIKNMVEGTYKDIESKFPGAMVKREGDRLIISGGFLYIPNLNAYVGKHTVMADDRVKDAARMIDFKVSEGHLTHIDWDEAEKIIARLGRRMLEPAEFWVFDDYLRGKDVWADILGKKCGGEWLGARVGYKRGLDFAYRSVKEIEEDKGRKEMVTDILLEDGVFNLGDLNRVTGLPTKLDGFECLYISPKSDLTAVSFHYRKDSHRPLFDLSLLPGYKDYKLGVREVLDAPPIVEDEKGEKQLMLFE